MRGAPVEDALDLLRDSRPDVAVLDFNLGREKVTPVALELKSSGIPFVLASGNDSADIARHDVFLDVINLEKPTDAKRLLDAVRMLTN